MRTKINLDKMHFYANHGVLPQETVIGNEFEVSLTLEVDVFAACASDDVRDTINYADVFDLVKAEMQIPSKLLEHVAGRILEKLKEHYPQIAAIEVRVAKMHPPVNGEMEKAEISIISDNKDK
jgi:dihydroneopterin aldolase